jgi:hypothetical protein
MVKMVTGRCPRSKNLTTEYTEFHGERRKTNKNSVFLRGFLFFLHISVLVLYLLLSCTRSANKGSETIDPAPAPTVPSARPSAIVQAGAFPLWFQFGDRGPVPIEAIEDACFSAALVPWPLAPHVRFMLAQGNDLFMAVNHEGLIRFAPQGEGRMALYRFSGGEFWRQYTVGAFIMFDTQPAALLYRDDRFLDSTAPLPSPRLWTFDWYSSSLKTLALPSLDMFAPEDSWDIDVLRRGGDDQWYYRAVKKSATRPELRMLRSGDLVQEGEQVSLGTFQNTALPQPLSAAPEPLREMLTAAFAESGCGVAAIVSPEFQTIRLFETDKERDTIFGFYSGNSDSPTRGAFLVAVQANGSGLHITSGQSVQRFSLPPLPEGFVYTGIGLCGDTIIASWEEQDEYSIGAAGFMVVRL